MNKEHVESSLDRIREIFQKASRKIESMKIGDKIPATVLASEIAKEYNKTGPQVYPILKYLLDDYPGVKITRGAKGGILKVNIISDIEELHPQQVDVEDDEESSDNSQEVSENFIDYSTKEELPIINT